MAESKQTKEKVGFVVVDYYLEAVVVLAVAIPADKLLE